MAILHVFLSLIFSATASVYEKTNPDVFFLNSNNFDKQVTKKREKSVSIVHFYRERDGKSAAWAQQISELAQDWQGVYIIGVINCDANEATCEAQNVRSTPVVKIYPPLPIPVQEYEGEVSAKALNNYCAKFVKSLVVEITEENYETFLAEKPSVPKVILFSQKPGTPTLFKALSATFEGKMLFGLARQDEDKGIVGKFKVKSFPKIVLYKTSTQKTHEFGGDLKFRAIFEWLNVFSETFVSGGQDEVLSTKPWMNQGIAQLVKQSAEDVCYKHEGYLCGILFLDSPPDDAKISVIKGLVEKYGSKKERGADVKFMWVDTRADPEYLSSFEGAEVGQIVFLKYGKRSRFVVHNEKLTVKDIAETIEKIAGGEGKFVNIKGKLPELNMAKTK